MERPYTLRLTEAQYKAIRAAVSLVASSAADDAARAQLSGDPVMKATYHKIDKQARELVAVVAAAQCKF